MRPCDCTDAECAGTHSLSARHPLRDEARLHTATGSAAVHGPVSRRGGQGHAGAIHRRTRLRRAAERPNVLIGSFAVLLALSYAVLPQPAFEPPAEPDSSSTVYFNDENAYLKQSADGRYWLCIDGHKPYELTEGDVQFYLEHSVFKYIRETEQ